MHLIVGLGNPGAKYRLNRHNAGFMFAESLAGRLHSSGFAEKKGWQMDSYLQAQTCIWEKNGETYVLAKPQTFMNKSGEAVRELVKKYASEEGRADYSRLIVAHDDLDIPLGKFRIVKGYGPKLHNGLESIENHLHFRDFLRVRLGVDNRDPKNRMPGIDYVLHDFTQEELDTFTGTFPEVFRLLESEYHLIT